MKIPEGQRLIEQLKRADPNASDAVIIDRASGMLNSGKGVPALSQVDQGQKLYKLVPERDIPSGHSPFFTDKAGLDKLMAGKGNIADATGLPNQSAAKNFDVFSITPKSGQKPTVFKSYIAPIEQGKIKRKGGEEQTIVPERSLFTQPKFEGKIKERF